MKTNLAFLFFLLVSPLYAEVTPVGPFNFGGGLNLQTDITQIRDDQSPDMCNCISNFDGSLSKRSGGEKYVTQARSSQPFTSIYRAYASNGAELKKVTIGTVGNMIVFSTSDIDPVWVIASSAIHPGQSWSYVTMNNEVIMTGDGLVDPIQRFNILTSSMSNLFAIGTSSESPIFMAKYLTSKSNYLMFSNIRELTTGSTYYPSRTFYSLLNQPSSTTHQRFFDIRTNDGDQITGAGVMFDNVNFFKQSSIHELEFTILNLTSQGGDQVLREIVSGYGLKAPRTLQNIGQFYAFAAQDGIRIWDGGRRSRLTVDEESRIISADVKPLMDKIIRAGTYEGMVFKYYKKKEWLMISYEDRDKFPRGANNSVLIYDLRTQQWFPVCGWLASSWETFDGPTDNGDLFYGSSVDGYVYKVDLDYKVDDERKEISINTMDSLAGWSGVGISRDLVNVAEGTASIKFFISPAALVSSASIVQVISMGEWYDKTKITKDDKISFQLFTTNRQNISSIRVDLAVNSDISGGFDTNFTSITLTSAAIPANSFWTTLEIPLSSFTIRRDWTDLGSELVPFANTLTYFGLAITIQGIGLSSTSIDNVRVVQNKNSNPVNFYRFSKLFNMGTMQNKTFGQMILTYEKSPESTLSYEIYNDFSKRIRSELIPSEYPREIAVFGYVSTAAVTVFDDIDFSVVKSTVFAEILPLNGIATKDNVIMYDRNGERLIKLNRANFGTAISSYGELGSGTTNFSIVHQMDICKENDGRTDNLYVVDMNNQRIKAHGLSNFGFVKMAGQLGTGTTSNFHQPTGIACDDSGNVIVGDEGNYRILSLSISTLGYVDDVEVDYNTIGDTSLEMDDYFVYVAYNKIAEEDPAFQDIVLEKRFKGNKDLVNRIKVMPQNNVSLSTYAIMGDIALRGRYVFVSFTDDGNLNSSSDYYLQKRLKSDFSIVNELRTSNQMFSVMGDPFAYKPTIKSERVGIKTDGRYLQLKFYDSGLDNNIRLINTTFLLDPQPMTY